MRSNTWLSYFVESSFLSIREKALKVCWQKFLVNMIFQKLFTKPGKEVDRLIAAWNLALENVIFTLKIVIFWVSLRLWVKPFDLLGLRQRQIKMSVLKPKMFAIAMLYKADVELFTRSLLAIENCVSETYFFSAEISDFWLKWNTRMFSWALIMAQHLVGSGAWVPWLAPWWLVLLGSGALRSPFQDVTIHPKAFDLWMFVLFLRSLSCGSILWFYDSVIWLFIASKARDYFQNKTKPYFLRASKES